MTDTVGFIRKLPHQLVDAFGATLEETRLAQLIVHVVDGSADEEELVAMIAAVEDVLNEIGAGEATQVLVISKCDQIDEERRRELEHRHRGAILVSAHTGEGLDALIARIELEFERTLQEVDLLIPYDHGADLALLHELAGDLEREDSRGRHPGARPPARRRRVAVWALRGARLSGRRGVTEPLRVKRLGGRGPLPVRAYAGDAGLDLHAAEDGVIGPGERAAIGTGITVEIPPGLAGLVVPRSGLADRHGIALVNAPGLIDAGYRGEIRVLLLNTDRDAPFTVSVGDRIAQLVLVKVELPAVVEVDELAESDRGEGGFGSTGA